MPTLSTTVDPGIVQRLSDSFHRCFSTLDVEDGVFTDDALFDLYPPFWRFQLVGPASFAGQLRAIATGPVAVKVLRTVATASGFVSETEETVHGPQLEVARHLWLCEIRGNRIAEVVGYCNGGWDDELRARHAAEAPMVRP